MAVRIQIRRDTASNWTSANTVLAEGEIGYETDTGKLKIGNGSSAWNSIEYFVGDLPGGTLGALGDVTITSVANGDFLRYSSSASAWINDPVNLSTDTVGDYVESLVAGTGVSLANNSGEGSTPTISIGQDVSSSASVTFSVVNADLVGNVTGNADTASTLQSSRIIELSGDVTGSASFDGSANINISVTSNADSIELGTDTTGNYLADVVGGTGVTVTHTPGEGSSASVAIGQDVSTSSSVTFSHVTADLLGNVVGDISGNADTATALETSRTFSLDGDLSGSVSFDGTSDVTITATIQSDSVALGTDTTGNFMSDVVAGTGVTVTHTPGESSTASIAIGQDVSTSASVTFSHVSADIAGNVVGNLTGDVTGNADTATALETARTISLSGDLSGSVSFDGTGDVTISATVQPDSVALGTDTTGNFMSDVVAGTGVTVTHTPGESSTASIAIGQDVSTSASVTFAQVIISGDLTVNGTTTTLNTENLLVEDNIVVLNSNVSGSPVLDAGIEIERGTSDNVALRWNETTDSWEITEDGTTYKDIAVGQDVETSSSVTFAHVASDVTGNVTGNVIGDLTGNADTATALETARTISLSGDLSGSVSFDGTSDVTVTATVQPDSVALGTDTTGNYMVDVVAGTGVTINHTPGEGSSASIEIGQNVSTSSSVTFVHVSADVTGDLTGNADTASTLETARTISLAGDLSGSVSFDGSSDVTITATVQPDSVALGTDTTGNYVSDVTASTGITVSHIAGEGSSPVISIGQDVATTASVTFSHVTADLTGDVTGNASTATTLETARAISLAGDLSGSVSFDGSSNVTITATVQPDSVALGTDTTGNFVADVVAGHAITVTHTPGEASSASVALNASLDDLTDVAVTTPEKFQTLVHDGSGWENEYPTVVSLASNAESTTLTVGTAVYLFGGTGNHASVKRADNSSDATSSKTVGLVAGSIGAGVAGPVITRGYLKGVDLSVGYTNGDILWLGKNGQFTTTKTEAPDHLVFIGVVVSATNNGIIYVATQNGYEINELHDVKTNGKTNKDVLMWNSASSVWVNEQINLGTDTVGDYVQSLVAGTGVTLSNNSGEGSTPTVAIGQDVSTSASVVFYSLETTHDLTIGRNLIVSGSVITENQVSLTIDDPFIYLNNSSSVINSDLGIAGNYNDGTYRHAGLFRDATDGKWKFFDSYEPEPAHPIDTDDPSYSPAPVVVETLESTVTTGTAPFTVASTTEVVNLHADTASSLHTARAISLAGDLSGSVSFDGSANVTLTATVEPNSVALGTDTTGNYMVDLAEGTGVTIVHTPGEGSTASISIGQSVATTASVTFAHVSADLTGAVTGNASTATALQTARAISLGGDLSGSVSFDGTGDVTITAAVQPDSVALGTDTTGNYMSDVVAGTGVTITHTPGEGSSASVAIGQSVATSASVTFAAVTANALVGGQSATTVSTTSATTVATFDKTVYRTAEFILQVSQGSKYTSQKVLVLHDGTNATHTRYGIVEFGSPAIPLTVTSDVDGNDVRLRVTISDANSTSASVRVFQTDVLV